MRAPISTFESHNAHVQRGSTVIYAVVSPDGKEYISSIESHGSFSLTIAVEICLFESRVCLNLFKKPLAESSRYFQGYQQRLTML